MVNNTTTVPALSHEVGPWSYFLAALCVLIFTVGLLGNSLVVIVYYHKRKLQIFELLVISLAIADWIGTVLMPPYALTTILHIPLTVIGEWGCKIVAFLWGISIGLSAMTLVLITVHRFMVIRWPLLKRPTRQQCFWLIAGLWLFGGVIYSPYLIRNSIQMRGGFCRGSVPKKWYVFGVLTIEMWIPITVITILYTMIICRLRKPRAKCQKTSLSSWKRNRKPIKLIVVVTVLFYVCYVPISIIHILTLYRPLRGNVIWTAVAVQITNSCINPFIYCKMEAGFRKDLFRMLSNYCGCTCYKSQETKLKTSNRERLKNKEDNFKITDV